MKSTQREHIGDRDTCMKPGVSGRKHSCNEETVGTDQAFITRPAAMIFFVEVAVENENGEESILGRSIDFDTEDVFGGLPDH